MIAKRTTKVVYTAAERILRAIMPQTVAAAVYFLLLAFGILSFVRGNENGNSASRSLHITQYPQGEDFCPATGYSIQKNQIYSTLQILYLAQKDADYLATFFHKNMFSYLYM